MAEDKYRKYYVESWIFRFKFVLNVVCILLLLGSIIVGAYKVAIFAGVILLISIGTTVRNNIARKIKENQYSKDSSNIFQSKYSDYLGRGDNNVNNSESSKFDADRFIKGNNNMWKCKNCGEYVEKDLDVCWNCQAKKG